MNFRRSLFTAALALFLAAANALPPAERFWGEVEWFRAPGNDLNLAELDTMALKLGTRLASMPEFIAPRGKLLYYSGGHSWFPPRPPSFVFHGAVPAPGSGFPTTPSRGVYAYYSFQSGDRDLDDFLRSAYLQEIDSGYAPARFHDYPVKSRGSFHNRMWASQAYAWHYLAQDEPLFGGLPWLGTAYGYFIDGISVILLASITNRLAKDPGDPGHLRYAATGVGLIAVNRLLTVPFGNSQIEKHNRIARSGYKVPR
jgi:hypothetical protein